MQSELLCMTGLLLKQMLLLACRHQSIKMQVPNCCRFGGVSMLRSKNWFAAGLEMSMGCDAGTIAAGLVPGLQFCR